MKMATFLERLALAPAVLLLTGFLAACSLDAGVGHLENATLALSEDQQYLYVAVSDASGLTDHIVRINVPALTTDLEIALPFQSLVANLRPAPGQSHTLAVQLSAPSYELFVYDDATARSASLQSTATGPTTTQTYTDASLAGSSMTGNMYFVNNLIYWDGGGVFNPASYTASNPFPLQTTSSNLTTSSSAAFDTTLNRAYFTTNDQPANATAGVTTIQGFELSTQTLSWLLRIPAQDGSSYITRWGTNGLAFFVNGGTEPLVLISGKIVTQ
jgi:hypothetical protein